MGHHKDWEKIARDKGLLSSEPKQAVVPKYDCDACQDTGKTGEVEGDCPAGRWNWVPCPKCKKEKNKTNVAKASPEDHGKFAFSATFCIPVKIESEANLRQHWAKAKNRKDKQEAAIDEAFAFPNSNGIIGTFRAWRFERSDRRFVVKLTRIGKRLLDGDNCQSGMKKSRDVVASWLQVNDGKDGECRWEYDQEIGKEYALKIEIRTEEY